MTDLNAPLDPTERDALAWRMLEERLEMAGIDVSILAQLKLAEDGPTYDVVTALHDALAYRRQT